MRRLAPTARSAALSAIRPQRLHNQRPLLLLATRPISVMPWRKGSAEEKAPVPVYFPQPPAGSRLKPIRRFVGYAKPVPRRITHILNTNLYSAVFCLLRPQCLCAGQCSMSLSLSRFSTGQRTSGTLSRRKRSRRWPKNPTKARTPSSSCLCRSAR